MGTLIAIGGKLDLNGPILPEFYRLSGGQNARIVILPTASSLPDSGCDCAEALNQMGLATPARVLPIHTRADASNPELCELMRRATGLFITGGDQTRLTAALRGTPFYRAMRAMSQAGGVIAGTSAGTAALSELMIASGKSGSQPVKNIARFSTGLGLIDSCVFDQHFRQRNRIGRLLYTVACHPSLLGIGVDENTAAIIEQGQLRVMGSEAVTLVDGRKLRAGKGRRNRSLLLGVQMHVMTSGARYDLQRRAAQ